MSEATPTPEAIAEVITELEAYRQRIIDDTMAMGQKIKMSKKSVLETLEQHPEIAKIDEMLASLRSQQEDAIEAN
jgi:hypothetical protein